MTTTTTTTTPSFSLPTPPSPKCSILSLTTFLTLFILFQIKSLQNPFSSLSPYSSSWPSFSQYHTCNPTTQPTLPRSSPTTFLPLKDLRFADSPTHSWFMSSLNETYPDDGFTAAHLSFPSPSTNNLLLCLSAHNTTDGSQNSYALAHPSDLPPNSTLLPGLTFVSDTYYDYRNIWHGLSALVPFISWHKKNRCEKPERWVLFHWGELRTSMADWVRTLAEAATGREVRVEGFGGGGGVACLERAVLFRHNEGKMTKEGKREVYDMMRCKAREYCGVKGRRRGGEERGVVRLTLFFRVGGRSFKNETAVVEIF